MPLIVDAQVGINSDGSSPQTSAMLDVKATGKGLLPPRMNLSNRPSTPATGLFYYQTDNTPGYYFYSGSTWQRLGLSASDYWDPNGSDIYFSTGKVALGTTSPNDNGLNVRNYIAARGAVRGVNSNIITYAEGYLGFLDGQAYGLPSTPDVLTSGYWGLNQTTEIMVLLFMDGIMMITIKPSKTWLLSFQEQMWHIL